MHDMALRHKWHNDAWAEFEETLHYVYCEFGVHTAERVYAEALSRVRQLCLFPDSGIEYEDLYYEGSKVRILHMEKSSLIYCHDENEVIIIAFWNNRRNPRDLSDIVESRGPVS